MSENIQTIIDTIKGMTMLELSELVKTIEEEFGVRYDRRTDTQFSLYMKLLPKAKEAEQFAKENKCGKTVSIVCFEIASEYRGKGIASAFIERVCNDSKEKGYVAVEGYAKLSEERDDFDFQGPVHLYKKAGFVEVARENGQAIMRKML